MSGSVLGAAVKRAEDPRFIRGRGTYIPNQVVDGALFLVPVRSTIPHGTLNGVETSFAADMPGVVAIYTAEDLDVNPTSPGVRGVDRAFSRPTIARDVVRFAGEIVAVVIAESEREGVDAAGMVFPDIDPLPVVTSVRAALEPGAPVLHPDVGSNVALTHETEPADGLFDDAERIITTTIHNQRLAAVPIETNSALAIPHDDRLEIRAGSQNIFGHRINISKGLGVERETVHAVVPDVGGGFGAKFYAYPEQILVAAAALKLGVPVRWHESRRDNMVGMTHGRAQDIDVEIGVRNDGTVVGIRVDVLQDVGAYPLFGAYLPTWTMLMAVGPYAIPKVEASFKSVVTNTTPVHAYRGAGRPEATHLLERTLDVVATELGLDPTEIRRRNFVQPEQFPYTTPTGAEYDTGDYGAALDRALAAAGYAELRNEQRRRRDAGDRVQLGIGVSSYVEITAPEGNPQEWAEVEVDEGGGATIRVGTSGHGQGHETAFAQLVSGLTSIPMDEISFVQGDTDKVARGAGTGGSRSLQLGGSAVYRATEEVVAKARRIVAEKLEAAEEDIVVTADGRVGVAGVPDSGLTWGEIAAIAAEPDGLSEEEPGLAATLVFEQGFATFPFGTHVSVVEVDTVTGNVELLRHIAVDDCGTVLNPLLVAGQVHGGFAQGAGQALWEHVRYDEDGNPLSGNLTSYLVPTAGSLPSVERQVMETPTPHNPLGAKGIGEAATIGSTPAIHNAVIDALAPFGIRHLDMPLTPARIWEALEATGQ
ncbi:MAG TPA: xanthine dehydrogenase family protein molybdopterin-binding subunit [Acidimicrobiia bacterium]|jgi:carbon-monoxide dehydrogenase large subunit|nr:xanthine dehydrogenase family protein molybdopterin-binding subunit [Acidimicrobiia bacterium]